MDEPKNQAHSLPGDVGTGDYVATDPRQMGDGDPYWMVEIQASGGYHSVAEIYSDTADNARAKASAVMAAWSSSANEPARALVAMLNAGGMQEGCRVFDHTPEEIGLHVMENHADILAALTPSALSPEHCQRCGHNNPSWSAPSPLWNAVIRGGSIDGEPTFGDMVCAACFMELAEQQGIASDWSVNARNVAVPLETTTPSGRVWDDDKGLWVSALSGDAGEGIGRVTSSISFGNLRDLVGMQRELRPGTFAYAALIDLLAALPSQQGTEP